MQIEPGHALPFIVYDDSLGYTLSPQAEAFLLSDALRNQPLAVMSVCGKYRTGKSFLINKIILEQEEGGFQVGPTINPCTKGLWLWNHTLDLDAQNEHLLRSNSRHGSNHKNQYDSLKSQPEPQEYKVLLVDTEGFGGIDEGENHDSKILLFSLLLSSYLVYNSLGSIDETAIQQLALIINLAKQIEVKIDPTSNEEEDLGDYLPSFMWVVRDFALKLEDSTGTPISQKEYLERALELQKGVSDTVEQKNRIRRLLKMFFRDRDCSTLVRPSESEKAIQNLANVTKNQLRKEFVEQAGILRKKLFRRIRPKMMNGSMVTGGMLCEMARTYVTSINEGAVPNIETAWNSLLQSENENATRMALAQVESEGIGEDTLGLDDDQLRKLYKATVVRLFRERAVGSKEEQAPYIAALKTKTNELFQAQLSALHSQQKQLLEVKYAPFISEIRNNLKSHRYADMQEYRQDMFQLQDQFDTKDRAQQAYWLEVQVELYSQALDTFVTKASEDAHHTRRALERHQNSTRDQEQKMQALEAQLRKWQDQQAQVEREQTQEINALVAQCQKDMKSCQQQCDQQVAQVQKECEVQIQTIAANYEQERQQQVQEQEAQQVQRESIAMLEDKLNQYEVQCELQAQKHEAQQEQHVQLMSQIEQLSQSVELLKEEAIQKDELLAQQDEIMQQLSNNNNHIDDDVINQLESYKDQIQKEQSEKLVIFENYQELEKETQNYKTQQQFYQQQLADKISLQEELMKAIQSGFNEKDRQRFLAQEEIIARQKSQLERQSVLLEQAEEKIERQREYKNLLYKAQALQCKECSQLVRQEQWGGHLNGECKGSVYQDDTQELVAQQLQQHQHLLSKQQQESELLQQQHQERMKEVQAQTAFQTSQLHLCINQTMVKESADKIPYTEYVIQIKLQNGAKWSVNRKYKHFCQLYQDISQSIANYRFPESAASIIKTFNDINTLFSSKRPTVIEERRTALQTFLRDLLKDEKVRSLRCYQVFLELENVEKSIRFQSHNSHNNSICNSGQQEKQMSAGPSLSMQQSKHTRSQNQLHRTKNQGSQSFQQHTQPEHRDIQHMIDNINSNVNSNQYIHFGQTGYGEPQRVMKTNH